MARESASIPGLVDLNTVVDIADRKTQEVTIPPAAQILQAKPQREIPNVCVHHQCVFSLLIPEMYLFIGAITLKNRVLFMHVHICT